MEMRYLLCASSQEKFQAQCKSAKHIERSWQMLVSSWNRRLRSTAHIAPITSFKRTCHQVIEEFEGIPNKWWDCNLALMCLHVHDLTNSLTPNRDLPKQKSLNFFHAERYIFEHAR
jgi:hypothetical protein